MPTSGIPMSTITGGYMKQIYQNTLLKHGKSIFIQPKLIQSIVGL